MMFVVKRTDFLLKKHLVASGLVAVVDAEDGWDADGRRARQAVFAGCTRHRIHGILAERLRHALA